MSTKTDNTTAAALLRTHGAPSFVVSLGTSTWSNAAPTHAGERAYTPLSVDIPNPMVVRRDARVATKQDRPPRGVPR
jgi:hypothetical protein